MPQKPSSVWMVMFRLFLFAVKAETCGLEVSLLFELHFLANYCFNINMFKPSNLQLHHSLSFFKRFSKIYQHIPQHTGIFPKYEQTQTKIYHRFCRIAYWQKPKKYGRVGLKIWCCMVLPGAPLQ